MFRIKHNKLPFLIVLSLFFFASSQNVFAITRLSEEFNELPGFNSVEDLTTNDTGTNFDILGLTSSPTPISNPEPVQVFTPPQAVNPIDLTVSPVNLNLETEPGSSVRSSIKVLNNSIETEYLEIELKKFIADRNGSNPKIMEFEEGDDFRNWLTFDRNKFEVNPGEWETIDVTFSPPANSALSYYYAIVVKRQVDTVEEGATAVVTGAPAILVLTKVDSPNTVQELQLVDFKVKKKFYEYLPSEFEVTVKNSGNVHLSPLGNIFIDKGNTKDLAILSFNKANGLILPDSERVYDASWSEGFPVYEPVTEGGTVVRDEDGKIKTKLNWDISKVNQFRFGKYTAHLLLVYDNGLRDVPIESIVTFWVIPWRLILIALVIIVLISMGVLSPILMLSRRVRKNNQKY